MTRLSATIGADVTTNGEREVRIALLGPLRIERNGSPLELTGPKRRALLVALALEAGRPVSRDRIIEALWPERTTGREESTLRVHVSHLRDVIEPARDEAPEILITKGSSYMLDQVAIDIERFERLVGDARDVLDADPAEALELLDQGLGLWRGRALQDVEYEEFAQAAIHRLERTRDQAIEDRAAALVELGADATAIESLEMLVRADPTQERPISLLMRALYRTGRHADALRVARRHARHLAERGLEPSPAMARLEDRILRHDPSLLPASATSPALIEPGRSVRGYELREEIGSGSVGTVYRSFQPAVGRQVAVKVIRPELAQEPEFVRRFAEEARAVAGLEHPHITPLHDFWREPSGAFIVMRWMEGGNLGDRLGRRWDRDELGRVFDQIADALAYAHGDGIVHRALTPTNVLFDGSGNAYLSDFGPSLVRGSGAAAPELRNGAPATVASDVFATGSLLADVVAAGCVGTTDPTLAAELDDVVHIATALEPGDRYPDLTAFRSALRAAIGPVGLPMPRRVRRNPYKGLAAFEEGDRIDFHGRDDMIEAILDEIGHHGLTAVIGPSGSGKSSVVMAGVVPALRDNALPGSDEWSIATMVPGTEPFDELHLAVRDIAIGHPGAPSTGSNEIRDAFAGALDGPSDRALLVVDQFEELFAPAVGESTRRRFLDELVELAVDPVRRVRIVVTLRADFVDRPLGYPRFGELLAAASVLLAPLGAEQVEDVIRRPASRAGVEVEPGLVAEIIRDLSSAPAQLPLLQYVLTELFERRQEDRLTIRGYRDLGGVQGVLERRAEATFASLAPGAQAATRQVFLRLVQLGEHGEETRRRLPLSELHGLGRRAHVDEALAAFSAARLLTYDRDPVSRGPTVEVAHETVITQWTRYRVWTDEARDDLLAHRRLSAAAATWAEAGEDPAYLLTAGPLAAAARVASSDRVALNELESRYVAESQRDDAEVKRREARRIDRERTLQHRARRRLAVGLGATAVAVLVAAVAAVAWIERQRANELAEAQERQSTARELAAAAISGLDSADPELSLLLAIEAARLSLDAGEDVLPDVVEALHLAIINPRPSVEVDGAGQGPRGHLLLDWADDGTSLAFVDADGGATLIDAATGEELARIGPTETPTFGVDLGPGGETVLTVHADGVRTWRWSTGEQELDLGPAELGVAGGAEVTTATASTDGDRIAVGDDAGVIRIWNRDGSEPIELRDHAQAITSVDFDPTGDRLVSGAADGRALVWDLAAGTVEVEAPGLGALPISHVVWHPAADVVAVIESESFLFDATTGVRVNSLDAANVTNIALAFDASGALLWGAGGDGFTRVYGAGVGGAPIVTLPNGGVPLRAVATDPSDPLSTTVATLGTDGRVRIWRDTLGRSELPSRSTALLYPHVVSSDGGDRYVFSGHNNIVGLPPEAEPFVEVVDASSGEVLLRRPTVEDFALGRRPAISPDGSRIAFAGPGGDIEIVDVETGASTVLPSTGNWTSDLDFSPDGTILGGAGFDGSIAVWEVTTGELLTTSEPEPIPDGARCGFGGSATELAPNGVDEIAFHPDGSTLASAALDCTVRLWDITGGEHRVVHQFDHAARSLAYTPDGSTLVAADSTGTVVALDVASGRVVDPEFERVPGTTELVLSPDGRLLAGAGPGRTAHLWDMETGRIVRRFRTSVGTPLGVAFVADGAELRVSDPAGFDLGFVLDPARLVEIAEGHAGRELTDEECQRYVGAACRS